MKSECDVLILGAGAAGLACAYELKKFGVNSLILEARDRIGGRILTHHPSDLEKGCLPIELGAEFSHGASKELLGLIRDFDLPILDVVDNHLYVDKGKVSTIADFFKHLDKLMPKKKHFGSSRDKTVEEFIKAKRISSKWRGLFRSFVEGFHSADLSKIGVNGLALTAETNEADLNGQEMFRHPLGYSRLVTDLYQALGTDSVRFGLEAKAVRWSKQKVHVEYLSKITGEKLSIQAKRLVITLPLGVLADEGLGGFDLDPFPSSLKKALSGMTMGHVQRLVFRFRERFWETLDDKKPVSFMHLGPRYYFPTWWTQSPLRTPVLVAWQGGPKALAISQWSEEKKIQTAFETLKEISGKSVSYLRDCCVVCHTHDWSRDPLSQGAYTYIKAGGYSHAREILKPVAHTLFFAGESTCFDASRGTVHGAVRSGQRVARSLIKDLKRGVFI
jgi:monoamine oxidase